MNYYIALLLAFITGFLITEFVKRYITKRKVIVTIKHKDGSIHERLIYSGKDPEVEKLLAEAKEQQEA